MLASAWGEVVRICRVFIDAISWLFWLNASFEDELGPTPRPLKWLNVCAILLTVAATGLAFDEGLRQRMHRVAPDSVDMLAQTVGIDISHRLYGTTGYVGRTEVLEALFQGGFTGRQNYLDKLGIQYPANVEMPDRINGVIQQALTLKDLPKDATFANRRLYAPEANDPGFVDYVSWSFDIFGFRIESLYYFYFLILSASIVFFLICFRADALPLVALSGVMVSFLILLNSELFTGVLLRTVHNQRFLGTLCVVPYLHLLFTLLIYRKPTPARLILTVLQLALFVFVMFTRSSAFWMILSIAVIIGLNVVFQNGLRQEPKVRRAVKLVLSWPILLVLGGLLCSLTYKAATIHPIYGIGIFLPYHMVWHNAYMGLGLHPDWNERGDKHNGKPIPDKLTDNMAWKAAAAEAEDRYGLSEAYTVNTEVGGLPGIKMALHEKLIKERFLRFACQHPRFMLELMLWYKPKMLLTEFAGIYIGYTSKAWNVLCIAIFVVVAVMARRLLDVSSHVGRMFGAALLTTGVMSLAPLFWSYPMRHVAGEQFFIWTAILLYFAILLLSKAWSIVRPVARLRV